MKLAAGDIIDWSGTAMLTAVCDDRLALCLPWPIPDVYSDILEKGGDVSFKALSWPAWDAVRLIGHVGIESSLVRKFGLDVPVMPVPMHHLDWPTQLDGNAELARWAGPRLWDTLQASLYRGYEAIVIETVDGDISIAVSAYGSLGLSGADIVKHLIREQFVLRTVPGRLTPVRLGMRGVVPTYYLGSSVRLGNGMLLERGGSVPNVGAGCDGGWVTGEAISVGDVFEFDGQSLRLISYDNKVLVSAPWSGRGEVADRLDFQSVPRASLWHLRLVGRKPLDDEETKKLCASLPARPLPMVPYTWTRVPTSKTDMAGRLGSRVEAYGLEDGYIMPCSRVFLHPFKNGACGHPVEVKAPTNEGFSGLDLLMAAVGTQIRNGGAAVGGVGLLRRGVVDGAPSFQIEVAMNALTDVWV